MSLTVDVVIDELGYRRPGELLGPDARDLDVEPSRRQTWREARERLDVQAAFFQDAVPLVYFRGLRLPGDSDVEQVVQEVHRQGWNHARAPFLVVVLPNEVRVLDNRSAPFDDYTILRGRTIKALRDASYDALLSGQLNHRLEGRKRLTVVDQLRADLRAARSALKEDGLAYRVANDLLGRCLFLQYLQDRGVLTALVPDPQCSSLTDAVNTSLDAVYRLFDVVYSRLNGDVFPISGEERKLVKARHLHTVLDFLRGVREGQLPMLDYYDFSLIPAEMLSNIYEEFVEDERDESGAHYTPEHIVDLALDEVLPANPERTVTVLDPACGSGMFLARAYRRLIDFRETTLGRSLTPRELSELLSGAIFGCDTMPSAVRVAAFSCYLVLLDRCSNAEIRTETRFPALLDTNLLHGDFFELARELPGPYDVIATNPPWIRWSAAAEHYVLTKNKPAGDKQLAHAFLWGCLDRLSARGEMAILMPAKTLYNTSGPNKRFRQALVEDTGIELVVDFSAFRHELFANAHGPLAVFVLERAANRDADITFCTPRPTPLSASTGRIVLGAGDIKRLPRGEVARRPDFFKTTLFGSLRDANFVERLRRRYPSLGDLEREGKLILAVGYQIRGGQRHRSAFLSKTRRIESKHIDAYRVTHFSPPADVKYFHRTRDETVFRGAHIVVARALDARGHVRAAFVDNDASFNDSVIGIAAPAMPPLMLQALTAILNSSLARYLLFVTGTSWGVERPRLEAQDIAGLPLPTLHATSAAALATIVDRAAASGITDEDRKKVDGIVMDAYGLSTSERPQVADMLRFGIDLHYAKARSVSFSKPRATALSRYRTALVRRLSAVLEVPVTDELVESNHPWATVALGFGTSPPVGGIDFGDVAVASTKLDMGASSFVLRRTLRIYRERGLLMTKPLEARIWTESAALQDADDIIAELLRAAAGDERDARDTQPDLSLDIHR